jgi:MFS family permease
LPRFSPVYLSERWCSALPPTGWDGRTIFTVSLLWFAAASVVMAFQTDAFGLNLWRFISGIGVGVELVTIDTYIAELFPNIAAAGCSRSIRPCNSPSCRSWRSWAGNWFRLRHLVSTVGAGWC